MATSRFIHYGEHGDARIHYLDSGGDDRGAPIVFVPGMTDLAKDYTEVMESFGRRTVVVELRGHGRSAAPAGSYDLAALSGDVGAVVEAITDGPVHVVTFSRGTSYAVAWTIDHPQRVRSISIGDYVPEERALSEEAERRLLGGRWRGTPVRERLDVDAAIATFRAAKSTSFWDRLSALGLPLLAVRAGNSPVVDDADWLRYRRLFPDGRLVEFPDSPHDVFRPERSRFPSLVRAHVDRVDGVIGPNSSDMAPSTSVDT
ncbi:alpha/beta fold hydrolase [Mycobacterium sp. CVI_P3]|uniref:Alpha/beta fold hydrolase n=1 Tax=Mycobacterium pinniadriaticum TaxID=2994102 RepID=A0ABT3SKY9_9MYCO|nr:alpha/beta fold hydrolase [Mycobacterium pinniadriaticum]MCX2933080.1 alpha/beta fold hydrolase [Mycobacterium pinniadriaticum]MCX2939502.1 alpha/beta fold hydrolase [Mycobacterium pinniadriaticum]